MSVTEKNDDEQFAATIEEPVQASILDEVFKERDSRKKYDALIEDNIKKSDPEVRETKEPKKSKDSKPVEDKDDLKESVGEVKNNPDDKKVEENDDDTVGEMTKLKKALNDSQKWGHTNNKRLKSVVKIIGSLKEQGVLNEDEFSNLNILLSSDSEEELESEKVSNDPLSNLIQIANKRISDLREMYEDDPLCDKKIESFDFFVNHATDIEKDELLEKLEEFKDRPIKLGKEMFKIGEQFYNENYKEVDEAGGLKELVSLKNSELKRLQKKVDKLESKLLEYNDYDKSNFKIDELGDTLPSSISTDEPGNVLGSLMKQRDRKKR